MLFAISLISKLPLAGGLVKRLLNSDIKSGKYLISDGHPLEWNELAEYYNVKLNQTTPGIESRKFNIKKYKT